MPELSSEEFLKLSRDMEVYHGVFSQLWKMGRPRLDPKAKTAFVAFNKDGNCIDFCFAPEFWKGCSDTQRQFVTCHESLHVIYGHGRRGRGLDKNIANKAMDIVINEGLVEQFGFDRKVIDPTNKYCWINTVFKAPSKVERDKCFEYYYELLKEQRKGESKDQSESGQGGGGEAGELVDSHEGLDSFDEETMDEIAEEIKNSMSQEELESLADKLKDTEQPKEQDKENMRGTIAGQIKSYVIEVKVVKKKKWETIIKKWARKYLKSTNRDTEQWAMTNRRLTMLPKDMFIPSDFETDDREKEEYRIQVWFFLDTSGSCQHLSDRFWNAARSLPEDRFNIRLFCFDTKVYDIDFKDKTLYGFGGTSFDIIENKIQEETVQKNIKYPDACFIVTDGYGNRVNPEKPERWYWFLSQDYRECIPKECKIYPLRDFE